MKKSARTSPAFLETSVVYQILLRAFTRGGTLSDATRLLPFISELGVDIVYLCPVVEHDDDPDLNGLSPRQKKSKTGNPKNPYRHKDFFKTDPEYGNDEDLRDFVKRAHQLGLRVILDLVYMHCGPQADILKEHPEFIQHDDAGNIKHNDYNFPLINFESVELREYFWRNMEYFIRDFGVDGYRCDASDYVPLDFWDEGRCRMEMLKPDCIMLAEGHRKEDQYYAFDLNYAFPWKYGILKALESQSSETPDIPYLNAYSDEIKTAKDLRLTWQKMHHEYPAGTRFLRNMDDHDITNDSFELRHDCTFGTKAVDAALVVNFTIDGVPMLYNGQEIADTSRHSIFANRYYGQEFHIDWSNAVTATGRERFKHLQALIKLRHEMRPLNSGDVIWLEHNCPDEVLAYIRKYGEEQIIVAVNISDRSLDIWTTLPLESSSPEPLYERGVGYTFQGENIKIQLQPYGFTVLNA